VLLGSVLSGSVLCGLLPWGNRWSGLLPWGNRWRGLLPWGNRWLGRLWDNRWRGLLPWGNRWSGLLPWGNRWWGLLYEVSQAFIQRLYPLIKFIAINIKGVHSPPHWCSDFSNNPLFHVAQVQCCESGQDRVKDILFDGDGRHVGFMVSMLERSQGQFSYLWSTLRPIFVHYQNK